MYLYLFTIHCILSKKFSLFIISAIKSKREQFSEIQYGIFMQKLVYLFTAFTYKRFGLGRANVNIVYALDFGYN